MCIRDSLKRLSARLKGKSSFIISLSFAALVGLWLLSGQIGGGPDHGGSGGPAPAEDAPAETAALPTVRVKMLTAEPRATALTVTGRTNASRRVRIRAETPGRVDEIGATEGTRLSEGDLIVQLAPDDRLAQLAEARALLQQRQLEYNAAVELGKKGFRSSTKLAENRAALDSARAYLERIEIDIDKTEVTAPFAGILNERFVERGDYLKVGDNIAELVDLDPLKVVGAVSERHIQDLEPGDPASARLVDGRIVRGQISFVSAVADPATRTFRIELEVPNPEGDIRDGVTAELNLPVARSLAHFVSPAALTLSNEGEVGIKTVRDDNTVEFYPVTIITDERDGAWVTGLPDKARVIVVGQEFVREGSRVDPVSVDKDDVS